MVGRIVFFLPSIVIIGRRLGIAVRIADLMIAESAKVGSVDV